MTGNQQARVVDASDGALLVVVVEYHRAEHVLVDPLANHRFSGVAFQIGCGDAQRLLNGLLLEACAYLGGLLEESFLVVGIFFSIGHAGLGTARHAVAPCGKDVRVAGSEVHQAESRRVFATSQQSAKLSHLRRVAVQTPKG